LTVSEDSRYDPAQLVRMATRRQNGRRNGIGTGWLGVIPGGRAEARPDEQGMPPDDSGQPYDENLLLVASNDRGAMETIAFKIPEAYLAWARLIVESRRYPQLRTKSDVGRLGFERVLSWLSSLDPGEVERSVMHQLAQMNEKIAWERRNLDYVKHLDEFSTVISDLLTLPAGRLQASKVLRTMKRHFAAMEPSFYKTHAEKMFNDRFGAYEQAGLIMVEAGEQANGGGELVEEEAARLGSELGELEEMLQELEGLRIVARHSEED